MNRIVKVQILGCIPPSSELIEARIEDDKFICPHCYSATEIIYYTDSRGKHPNTIKCHNCGNVYGIVLRRS